MQIQDKTRFPLLHRNVGEHITGIEMKRSKIKINPKEEKVTRIIKKRNIQNSAGQYFKKEELNRFVLA